MNLTTGSMARYIGGQLEIVGGNDPGPDGYRFRGKVSKIEVIPEANHAVPGGGQAATLHVEFEYICKFQYGVGYKPDENKPYDLSLVISGVSDIGNGRLAVNSPIVGEMSVFYPPSHHQWVNPDGTMTKRDDH